jgi:ribonuclease D
LWLIVSVISEQSALLRASRTVLESPWVALDTEADSLHAYPEKICLIQISVPDDTFLIDSLAGLDLQPLLEALLKHDLLMHGADYDLRLLHRTYQFSPGSVFDTMRAARLLGYTEVSLAALVQRFLEVTLPKGSQKANWAQRPLSPAMANYARNDTYYLKPIADRLRHELTATGRLAWHAETCASMVRSSLRPRIIDPETIWRIKGSGELGRPGLSVLRELWHWREQEAINANMPPFFVLSHESMVTLANTAAEGGAWTARIPARYSQHRRERLSAAVERGLQVPAAEMPRRLPRGTRPRQPTNRGRWQRLRDVRDDQARSLGIDPSLIASKATLDALASDDPTGPDDLLSWQRELLATALAH